MIILFLNHKIQSCGVYQYGLRLFNILKNSYLHRYLYKEIDNYNEYNDIIYKIKPEIIIYNYHVATMDWLNNNNIFKNTKNIGVPHESNGDMFDIILSIDPNETETNKIFNIPRPIYENVDKICDKYQITNEKIKDFINYNEGLDVPIFGSFGFGFTNKGFDKIIQIVNNNYDYAIIKMVITFAHFDPNRDTNIKHILQVCNTIIRKPNIKLMISTDFFTNEEVLLFLASNTCNIFLYDMMNCRGVSSVIDYAVSVNKPVVISDSYMFRHIYSDDICVYKTNIREAIENSKKMLPNLLKKYSNKNLINKINNIINNLNNQNIFLDNEVSITAYYYIHNYNESANVTHIFKKILHNYKNNNIDTFTVSNDIFTDTFLGSVKTLFINMNINNTIFELAVRENEEVSLNYIFSEINKHLDTKKEKYLIETSIGEIIDKYSILEIKSKYISDTNKLQDINNEMKILEQYVADIKTSHFYKMLLYINEEIWLDTDIIKELNVDNVNKDYETICKLAEIYNRIFDNNQKRFRLKNHFNIVNKSNIKEHKSYAVNSCFINISEEKDIYSKIPEINYLCISYDIIYFSNTYKQIINNFFINTNIKFIEDAEISSSFKIYDLQLFTINTDIKDFFDFNPIKYKSPGKLGDFLNQLSVICENYYKTGKKGELYIYDLPEKGDKFVFGIENTYADTYNTIISLDFIKKYKIYNSEAVDIDLSTWRKNIYTSIINKENWFHIYKNLYNVNWGYHKWLKSSIDPIWNNKIIINITPYRFISQNCIVKLTEIIKDNINECIFISNEKEHYDYFSQNIGLNIEYYKPKKFEETVIIVNSCKIGYFGLSSMAVIANALHKNHYIMCETNNIDYYYNNLKDIIPHVLDIFI
jgi:hypothetical protein